MAALGGLSLHDLAGGDPPRAGLEFDACVVGAGAAGSYLARALASRGMSVALCEAGGRSCGPSVQDCFDAEFSESIYSGATAGRAFGWGGATSRWGALLFPHSGTDAPSEGAAAPSWQSLVRTVHECAPEVLRRLGWSGTTDFAKLWESPRGLLGRFDGALKSGLVPMEALFLPFRRKNLAWLFEKGSERGLGSIDVFSNAIAARWHVRCADRSVPSVDCLEFRSPGGHSMRMRARHFIVAAGALESTRLVLELADALPAGALPGYRAIGRGLGDHLSLSIGDFEGEALDDARDLFAPTFEHGWMRSTRLLGGRAPGEPRGFAHVIFEDRSPAFMVAKECLQALQARRLPRVGFSEALAATKGVMCMAHARYLKNRLYFRRGSPAHLQLDLEQCPSEENAIELAPHGGGTDTVGRRKLVIRWAMRSADLAAISKARAVFLDRWASAGRLPALKPRAIDLGVTKPHDAYHPVGTLRMGSDSDAVVDNELALRGVDGVHVVSTAVFPSAGTANPTFSMLCLAEDLARRISARPTR